jgi:hypothetical protein
MFDNGLLHASDTDDAGSKKVVPKSPFQYPASVPTFKVVPKK